MANQRKSFEVIWRIENVISWFEIRNDTLYSHPFLAETLDNTRWRLSLSTKWGQTEKYISLTLQRDYLEDYGTECLALNYELLFLSGANESLKSKRCIQKFAPKTVSYELNVKQDEMFNQKKEAYLPESVLVVGCRMWNSRTFTSIEGRCSIQSVIGQLFIVLQGKINVFDKRQIVNLMSTSPDISLVSLAVYFQTPGIPLTFKRTYIECKNFDWYSFELFLIDESGNKNRCTRDLAFEGLLISAMPCVFYPSGWASIISEKASSSPNGSLTIQLEIKYSPGVQSECIKYECNNPKKPSCEDNVIKHVKAVNRENIKYSNESDIQVSEHQEKKYNTGDSLYGYEDEYFDGSRISNILTTTLKKDLTSLYNDRLFCDTKLRNDSETFPAHKCVLSARSPVFKKMLTTDMKEAAGGCISVPDISSDTLRRMLQFLYTNGTGDLEMKSAVDLYVASDKYDIVSLRELCLSFMKKNLHPLNVCEVLVLADLHQDKNLESAASEYVLDYDEEVFGSDEWKLFMQNYSGLAARVMYLKCLRK